MDSLFGGTGGLDPALRKYAPGSGRNKHSASVCEISCTWRRCRRTNLIFYEKPYNFNRFLFKFQTAVAIGGSSSKVEQRIYKSKGVGSSPACSKTFFVVHNSVTQWFVSFSIRLWLGTKEQTIVLGPRKVFNLAMTEDLNFPRKFRMKYHRKFWAGNSKLDASREEIKNPTHGPAGLCCLWRSHFWPKPNHFSAVLYPVGIFYTEVCVRTLKSCPT